MNILKKTKGKLLQIIDNNPFKKQYYQKQRNKVLSKEFLESNSYDQLFLKYVEDNQRFDHYINDAQDKTRNFMYRHQSINKILGAWRWKGLFLRKKDIIPIIFNPKNKGIDFGGAFGPVNPTATIVDFAKKDIFGKKIKYHNLNDIDFKADYLFSSHTLEHIDNLEDVIKEVLQILKPHGQLILNLPSHTCIRWRYGVHTNKKFNDHKWTFALETTEIKETPPHLMYIDKLIKQHFAVKINEYTGDNSIFILAEKT